MRYSGSCSECCGAKVRLDGTRVVTIVDELVSAGMAENVGVGLDAQIGCVEPFVSAC